MPELAEVEYYRRRWAVAEGDRVKSVALHAGKRIFRGLDPNVLSAGLSGQTMKKARAHGKQLNFCFGQQHWLGIHLGMTGRLLCEEARYKPQSHDHLCLYLDSGRTLVFNDPRLFGRVRFDVCAGRPKWLQGLPPDILSEAYSRELMEAFLQRRSRAPAKAVLLMQEAFPGVGNWMADEILWRARIAPTVPVGRIGARKRGELFAVLKEVCADALRVIAPDWGRPPDAWLFNHRWRDGGKCPQTGGPLKREQVGGRTTCWSPRWQRYRGY